jgi:HEPN domain-containing protein
MNRAAFQELSRIRLQEAQVLFDNGHYSGAYYLAGYAVECALKACIARRTRAEDFPLDRRALENVYTRDLERLLKGADLPLVHQERIRRDIAFADKWLIVRDWSEESRYRVYTRSDAAELLLAITDQSSGIMTRLRTYW